MPFSSSQFPRSLTALGNAGSGVGRDHLDESLARRRAHEARASGLNTEGRNPSWPFRELAEPAMSTHASTSVYSYPTIIDIPPPQIHDLRESVDHPVPNGPEAVTSVHPLKSRLEVPLPPLERYRTQGNNFRTDPRRQRPRRRLPVQSSSSTIQDDSNKHPKHDD